MELQSEWNHMYQTYAVFDKILIISNYGRNIFKFCSQVFWTFLKIFFFEKILFIL